MTQGDRIKISLIISQYIMYKFVNIQCFTVKITIPAIKNTVFLISNHYIVLYYLCLILNNFFYQKILFSLGSTKLNLLSHINDTDQNFQFLRIKIPLIIHLARTLPFQIHSTKTLYKSNPKLTCFSMHSQTSMETPT